MDKKAKDEGRSREERGGRRSEEEEWNGDGRGSGRAKRLLVTHIR